MGRTPVIGTVLREFLPWHHIMNYIEAVVRVIFALTLTPGIVVTISPITAIAVTILLILWTRNYGRTAQERALREAALSEAAAAT